MFENRVPRTIFWPKRDKATGEWRKLHNEELKCSVLLTHYYSGDQIKKNKMGRACFMYEGEERCIQDFGGGN